MEAQYKKRKRIAAADMHVTATSLAGQPQPIRDPYTVSKPLANDSIGFVTSPVDTRG
jgi:hypothetical protein